MPSRRCRPNAIDVLDQLVWINDLPILLRIAPPITKQLACDDVGIGALASRESILAMVAQF